MTKVLDFLYPIAQVALIIMIIYEYKRRKRANDFADYDNLKTAYIGIGMFSLVILLAIAGSVFNLTLQIREWLVYAKWIITVLILINVALFLLRISKITSSRNSNRQVE